MSEHKTNFFTQHGTRLAFLTLGVLVMVIYWQTVGFSFINLDDNLYVYSNPVVAGGLSWDSVKWALTAFHSANWHPLTWLSHILDAHFFGLNAGGHHATNILFHLINSILAFTVFRQMTGDFWKSTIVAALFAVHPAHVESVAWISERKDVLSTMFWLLTMLAYFRFAKAQNLRSQVPGLKPQVSDEDVDADNDKVQKASETDDTKKPWAWDLGLGTKDRRFYFLTVLLFAGGLMSKPMLVTLPFVLLLCDYWALERLKTIKDLPALLFEKIPLFALSAVSSYITILAQKSSGAVESLEFLPFGTRVLNAIDAVASYVGMMFYPRNLALSYPYNTEITPAGIIIPGLILLAITALCLWQFNSRKYLLMGWLWFLGTLVPVIGLVQVGAQSMADRYTYIPYFGLFVMLVWGVSDLFQKFKISRTIYLSIFGAVILIFTYLGFNQTALWRNHETIYKHTLAVTRNNVLIAHNLCHYLMTENRLDEAEQFCREAIDMRPRYSETYNTLGIIQMKREQYPQAAQNFRQTLELSPNYAIAYSNLSTALALQGNPEEAEKYLERAVNLSETTVNPIIWADSLKTLGRTYAVQKNYQKAAENFGRAVYAAPERADLRADLAMAYYELKRYDEAQNQIELSLRLNPNDSRSLNIYGLILLAQNRQTEAVGVLEKALLLSPDFAEAKENLKRAKEADAIK